MTTIINIFNKLALLVMTIACLQSVSAFAPSSTITQQSSFSPQSSLTHNMHHLPSSSEAFTSMSFLPTETVAAATIDPTTALTQVLSGVLNTPIILLVPILAAVGVASVLAFLLVSYANPADPDE